jgi:hypothetical protein
MTYVFQFVKLECWDFAKLAVAPPYGEWGKVEFRHYMGGKVTPHVTAATRKTPPPHTPLPHSKYRAKSN